MEQPSLMSSPQRGSCPPLMTVHEPPPRERAAVPALPGLTPLLWCYAGAAAFALALVHLAR
jgi:hypothetical protein